MLPHKLLCLHGFVLVVVPTSCLFLILGLFNLKFASNQFIANVSIYNALILET